MGYIKGIALILVVGCIVWYFKDWEKSIRRDEATKVNKAYTKAQKKSLEARQNKANTHKKQKLKKLEKVEKDPTKENLKGLFRWRSQ